MTEAETWAWVRTALARPYARDLYGIELLAAEPGAVTLALAHRAAFEHAPGFFQGSITSAIAELAASYSAATASRADWQHFAIQQSINFIGAAHGARLVAEGRVIDAGRSISVARATVHAEGDTRRRCATMTLTMRHRPPR